MNLEFTEYSKIDNSELEASAKKLDTIFEYNTDINRTAYLNWRLDFGQSQRRQFVILGDAFFETANNLIQQCLLDNRDKKADSWIFPIMFNIVHGIEVYLKAINVSLNLVLEKENTTIQGGHDILQLCNMARTLIIEYKNTNKNNTTAQMFTGIKVIKNFIDNIYVKTNDMTFARYPMNKDKKGHFYIEVLDNAVIDLVLLEKQIVIIHGLLEFIYEMPEMDIELKAELMSEYF